MHYSTKVSYFQVNNFSNKFKYRTLEYSDFIQTAFEFGAVISITEKLKIIPESGPLCFSMIVSPLPKTTLICTLLTEC